MKIYTLNFLHKKNTFALICMPLVQRILKTPLNVLSGGKYDGKMGDLYNMEITKTKLGGNVLEREEQLLATSQRDATVQRKPVQSIDNDVSGWFKFLQTDDGSIGSVFHSREEKSNIVNFKKTIAAAFQANFKKTRTKVEADPQSVHVAEYR